jgi:WD40 repeat protein
VAYSPNGRLLVVASHDGDILVWDTSVARLLSHSNQLRNKVISVEFDRTSSRVVAASSSGSIAVVDAASGMPVTMLDGPTGVVKVAHFDPTSQQVLGASRDGTARLWDAAAWHRHWSAPPMSDLCGFITSLEPDRRFVAVGCDDQPTRVWDTAQGRLLAELPGVTDIPGELRSAYPAVSSVGDRAAVARGSEVEVHELSSAHRVTTIQHDAGVSAVAFSASGQDIISGAIDGSIKVTRGNGTVTVLPASPAAIDAVGFLPDGRMVVADVQRGLRIYDPSGVTLAQLQTRDRVAFMRMSSDGRRLVTASIHMRVAPPELWDVERYRQVGGLVEVGQGPVYSTRFLSNEQIVTGCADGAFRLWNATTGELRQTYRGGSRFLIDATLSPDGAMLIGGGVDGQLRFWDLSSGRQLWTTPAHRSHVVGVHMEGTDIVTRGYAGDLARWSLPSSAQVIVACKRNELCALETP